MKSNDGKEQYKAYLVPFAYEMYGHIEVTTDKKNPTIEELQEIAAEKLKNMNYGEMEAAADYLPDSDEIDYDGIIRTEDGLEYDGEEPEREE